MDLDDISGLGPLPQSDENARLQRESIKALNKLLAGLDILVFRDERVEDYGVDGSLEVNVVGRMTNFRAQVQMKSTGQMKIIRSGYVALEVATANLNYLLNGSSPIYILWDSQSDEFWFVWAQEENRRLASENPSWKDQDSITLQFRRRLTKEDVPSIAQRILEEGRQQREIRDRLAKATEGEPVFLRINADTLQITDASMATSLLLPSGMAVVAAGYPREVLELMRLVDASNQELPRMQLTAGYAEFMLGNYWEALGRIKRAMARSQELSEREYTFLQNLKDASDLHLGLIDSEAYEQKRIERAQALTGVELLDARQDALYRRCVRTADFLERSNTGKELREVTQQILNSPDASRVMKLNSKLLVLFVDGVEANLVANQTEFAADIRNQLFSGDQEGVSKTMAKAAAYRSQWELQAAQALNEARELNHPILLFQALYVALKIRIGRLFEESSSAIVQERPYEVLPATKALIEGMLEEARELNSINGSTEGRLQLAEARADFLEVQGDRAAAKALAAEIYPEALALSVAPIAEKAKALLDDDTLLLRWAEKYQLMNEQGGDLHHANQTDDELRRAATQMLLSMESPPARLDVVVDLLRSIRQICRERMNWCRYIQIYEDLMTNRDPKTAFSELPTRICHCDKFQYESEYASRDWSAVITTFKRTFCDPCSARDPKGRISE